MKKLFTFLIGFIFTCNVANSAGWWDDYVMINGTEAPTYWYWIGDNPNYATEFNGHDFGTVSTLNLNGYDMRFWGEGGDRTSASLFYKITDEAGTSDLVGPVEISMTFSSIGGNDFQALNNGLNVDLLAGLDGNTTYRLHFWAVSDGTNEGVSWLNNGGANYVATFTTDVTVGINKTENKLNVYSSNNAITAEFDGTAAVEIYSIDGKLITKTIATGQVEVSNLTKGVYVAKINDKATKVLVK